MNKMSGAWDESYDLVIVGSGAGAVCAALAAQAAHKTAIILEKTGLLGGSTGMSGGLVWLPDNPVTKRAGVLDSYDKGRAYLDACVGEAGPASSPARRHAFLTQGPRLTEFLEQRGMKFLHAEGYSDYHEGEHPGGIARGRSLIAELFDMRDLGLFAAKIRRGATPPIRTHEVAALTLFGKTWASRFTMLRLANRMLQNRLGRDVVGAGTALQARLFQIALQAGIPMWTETEVSEFVTQDGRIVGLAARKNACDKRIEARQGVLINAGGFSHSVDMRKAYQAKSGSADWSLSNSGDTGEMMQMAMAVGAATDMLDQCWWVPISLMPGGEKGLHPFDIGKPHCILVDSAGQRFVNEGTSYVTIGNTIHKRHRRVPAIPSWAILDNRHRKSYAWSGHRPGPPPKAWIESGYMKRAETIESLASQCRLDPIALSATIDRFNGLARGGVDTDFGRGDSAYNRFLGDPTMPLNPSLGAIECAPFYAVEIYPGDVGTSGGLLTDESARVLREDGTIIPGLYATGNATASVMGRSYPGAGASIAAAMVFGYIGARAAVGAND